LRLVTEYGRKLEKKPNNRKITDNKEHVAYAIRVVLLELHYYIHSDWSSALISSTYDRKVTVQLLVVVCLISLPLGRPDSSIYSTGCLVVTMTLLSVITLAFVFTLFGRNAANNSSSTQDPPDLLLANEKDIRRVKTKEKNTVPVVQNLSGAESIDFDIMNNLMYWTDMSLKKISSAYVNGSNVVEVRL
jgi:hypothetical protein